MQIDINHTDIKPELCTRCAACCRITFKIPNTNSRYRRFLRQIGFTVIPEVQKDKPDCCDDVHDIDVDMGYCRNLELVGTEATQKFKCKVYGTSDFPELCRDFTCVGWAKTGNAYNEKNGLLVAAQTALNLMRMEAGG